jgi:hypothetical protein
MWSKWLLLAGAVASLGMSARPDEPGGIANKKASYSKVEIKGTLEVEEAYLGVRVDPGIRDGSYAWELNFARTRNCGRQPTTSREKPS